LDRDDIEPHRHVIDIAKAQIVEGITDYVNFYRSMFLCGSKIFQLWLKLLIGFKNYVNAYVPIFLCGSIKFVVQIKLLTGFKNYVNFYVPMFLCGSKF
jgi:hypothetical protein